MYNIYLRRCVKRQDISILTNGHMLRCRDDEFRCKRSWKCIPREFVKDGRDDCSVEYYIYIFNKVCTHCVESVERVEYCVDDWYKLVVCLVFK